MKTYSCKSFKELKSNDAPSKPITKEQKEKFMTDCDFFLKNVKRKKKVLNV